MTLAKAIIKAGYRESNLIPRSQTDPTDAENTEALPRLINLLTSTLGNECGGRLLPWRLGQVGYTDESNTGLFPQDENNPLPNVRLICNLAEARTVNLPRFYDFKTPMTDGARVEVIDVQSNFAATPLTLNGNGNTILGLQSLVLDTDGTRAIYLYRADLADWVEVTSIGLEDELPFPDVFDDMFITMLALRLNPRQGQAMTEDSKDALNRSRSHFRSRYKQVVRVRSPLTLRNRAYQAFGRRARDGFGTERSLYGR